MLTEIEWNSSLRDLQECKGLKQLFQSFLQCRWTQVNRMVNSYQLMNTWSELSYEYKLQRYPCSGHENTNYEIMRSFFLSKLPDPTIAVWVTGWTLIKAKQILQFPIGMCSPETKYNLILGKDYSVKQSTIYFWFSDMVHTGRRCNEFISLNLNWHFIKYLEWQHWWKAKCYLWRGQPQAWPDWRAASTEQEAGQRQLPPACQQLAGCLSDLDDGPRGCHFGVVSIATSRQEALDVLGRGKYGGIKTEEAPPRQLARA